MKAYRLRMYSAHTRRDVRGRLRHICWRINQRLRERHAAIA